MLCIYVCRFWARFANRADRIHDVQLLSDHGAAQQQNGGAKAPHAADDPEAQPMQVNGQADYANGAPALERNSADSLPMAGMRQAKVPLSDDPFWDQE